MIFGKIDYLNLLPFHVYIKRKSLSNSFKKSIEFKKGVPSKLNKELYCNKIDAAIISSIESRHKKYKKIDMGIVAKKEVLSVLVRKNTQTKLDPASMTSNMLRAVLNIRGEVVIGDRALYLYLNEGKDNFFDLAKIWNETTGLPFVFARFCYIKHGLFYKKIVDKFLKSKIFIPNYILQKEAAKRCLAPKDVKHYLTFISYKINYKEKMALKLYLKRSKVLNFNAKENL